ncbi:nitrite/sulfite reductase [Lipingzhangella sp. LS1_29]|uniref:assimilatory sulfite reductase (ferredoxin) n=1 Tax=Lipingzhangella rawalii TaxID=2055835 RepID=A0ABU2H0P5_9ACTN|nr:nitrite/sulfite reductase [Lipingzhangella rawalii]MDS1268874.1 nitrite/sulfite reductase [Lipingzhangella rawalii]
MPVESSTQSSTDSQTKRPRPRRGEGQWALGYREPLNKNEENKKNDDGLNVRRRIIDIYSKTGFDTIDPADLRGRFRWFGLYTQRAPGIDGGRTAVLEPEDLEDRYFMLRIRIDGGQLNLEQLRTIAEISTTYGRDVADVTDRQNVQLHWIRIEDVPEIWERLEAVGLSTTEACGDAPRVILGCPLAGVAADEVLDATPQIEQVYTEHIGSPEFSNLPRKYKSSISGCSHYCTNHEVNDISFVGVSGPDGTPGYDVWVGGALSTNPMFGQRLGAFVRPDQVSQVWAGVTAIFRDYGYRRLRHRARLKFLLKDWGAAKFREVLEKEYLGFSLPDGPEPPMEPNMRRDHVGVHPQRDGNYYIGFTPRVGRVSGRTLAHIADIAEAHGSNRVRTTADQKMVLLDVAPEQIESATTALENADLEVNPSSFRRQTMACTGIEFCKLAIVETKQRGADLIAELERRLPDFPEPITVNLNGCPNSCARIQVADIGLKGQLVTDANGQQVEGYQVHLGGGMGLNARFGRKVRGLKTTAEELPDYVERVLRRFLDQRADGEAFATWVTRAEEADLK